MVPLWIRLSSLFVAHFLMWLPAPIRYGIGDFLGILWFDILRLRRKTVIENLTIAFPNWSKEKKIKVGRASLQNMGKSFIEFLCLPVIKKSWINEHVVFENFEILPRMQELSKGYFFLTLHLGAGDFSCAMLNEKGLHVHLISKKFKAKWLNDFWFGVRQSMGTKFIEPHGNSASFEILKALKNKENVIFVLDQFMGKPFGVLTKFFKKETGTAYGLALFALKTKVPVYPLYTYRRDDGKTVIRVEKSINLVEGPDRDATIQLTTQKYNDILEAIVSKYPEQWMWVHRRWKEFE